jgi:hypothetical protein
VVVDTLSRLMLFRNENDNAEVVARMGPLFDLCRDLHVALLLLHHTSKLDSGDFAFGRELRGAGAIFAMVDQALILKRVRGGSSTVRELRTVGRYRESPERLLVEFDPETAEWTLVEEGTEAARDRQTVQAGKLLGYVAEHPGENRSAVVTGAKVQKKAGLDVVRWLLDEGRLVERTVPGGGYGVFLP